MLPASLRIPAFRRLLTASTLAILGSMMTFIVLPLVAWHETGSSSTFAFVLVGGSLGMLVAMPFGGVIADRFDRRHVILTGQVCQLVIVATMLVAVELHLWWLLPLVSLVQTLVGSLTTSAGPALRRDVLIDEVRTQGTALFSAATSTAQLLAPLIGGALYGLVGFRVVMVVDMACIALAFLLVLGTRLDRNVTRPNEERTDDDDHAHPVRRTLGMPAEWWSVAVAIIGGSGLVAALVAARLGERLPPHRLIVIGAIAPTLGTLMLVGTPSSPRIVAGFVLIGCMVMIGIGGATLVQRRVASSHQGRINSLSVCSMQGSQLVGVLLAGALIDSIGPAVAMYVMIAGFCTASMLELFVARAARVAPTTFSEEQLAISA